MTAIDFPNTPSNGQAFSADGKTWIYNGTVWGLRTATASRDAYDIAVDNGFVGTESEWLASLQGEDGIIGVDGRFDVSATAPSSPVEGDAWFNSTTARMFIYYDGFWIETGVSVAGEEGPAGVVAATAPITYNSSTQTVGITQSGLTLAQSQITGLETALSGKQATITGGATTITSSNLTASRALASDSSGKVAASSVTSTELGYVSGVTSAIQTQLDNRASLRYSILSVPVNGYPSGTTLPAPGIYDTLARLIHTAETTWTLSPVDGGTWVVGDKYDVVQWGTGQILFAPASGVTIVSSGNKRKTAGQYSAVSVVYVATNTFLLVGDLVA